jgi:DDE_Tnp_1-associated
MTIAAILSGCGGWNEIEDYRCCKHAWFRGFLTLPSGVPSHDTFNPVFRALDPEELEKGFAALMPSIAKLTAGEVAAIDGKTLRGDQELSRKGAGHEGHRAYGLGLGQHQQPGARPA